MGMGNRKRKPLRIVRYANAMSEDAWVVTGEPIIFSKTGRLLDGQNRLAAAVRSDKSFKTHLVFGIDDDVFVAINSGKARTPGDTFYTAGVADSAVVSPAVRWLMIYHAGNPTARESYSNQAMWDFYRDHVNKEEMEEAVKRTREVPSKTFPRGALAAHFYMFARKHQPTLKKLIVDFEKGKGNAGKLTKALNKMRTENQGRLHDVVINALLVMTWNAYRAGKQIDSRKGFKWNNSLDFPTIA
jgi:hypothetical protein